MFLNPVGDGAFKGTRRHIYLRAGCGANLDHTRMGFNFTNGTDQIAVSAGDCLSWTARSNAGWIKITSGASGNGNGTVGYAVTENWQMAPREGTLTVAGETVKITQLAGKTPCPESPVNVDGTPYETIQDGYAGAADGDKVKIQYGDFEEDITFENDADVTIVGGYNCSYSDNPDFSTVKGRLEFTSGTVAVEKVIATGP